MVSEHNQNGGESTPLSAEMVSIDMNVPNMENANQQLMGNAKEFMKLFEERSSVSQRHGGGSALAGLDGKAGFSKVRRVNIEWKNLVYQINVGRGQKARTVTILDGLSGKISPGHLLAIMGPTGCGKTSLINVLAARLPKGGTLTGEVLANGRERTNGFLTLTAYVMQDDVLFHTLTVFETFMFAAELQLPRSVPRLDKEAIVMKVITELGLVKAKDTYVGNAYLRGVSGGERKRCNIGVQMMSNPSLIFLDEPTSGLDAFQAQSVMESLWTLARNGRTVVSTIHQPRSSIYAMFDILLLLSEGKEMYFGPAKDAPQYFEQRGFPFPDKFNPADFFLDIVSPDYRAKELELASKERIQLLANTFQQYEEDYAKRTFSTDAKQNQQLLSSQSSEEEDFEVIQKSSSFRTGVLHQYFTLLRRSSLQTFRDKLVMVMTAFQSIFIAILLGLIYLDMDKSKEGIQNRSGLLFFVAINTTFGNMFAVLNTFPIEKGVVNRERSSKLYRVLPYFFAKWTAELPVRMLISLIYSSIVYWMTGLNSEADRYFIFLAIIVLEALVAYAMGMAVSALCKTDKMALALAPTMTVVLILFGGLFLNQDSMPDGAQWIKYISHIYWAFRAFTRNEFEGQQFGECDTTAQAAESSCKSGEQVLEDLGFGGSEIWESVVGLILIFLGWNLVGYTSLRLSKPRFQPITQAKKSS